MLSNTSDSEDSSDIDTTVRAFAIALKSVKSSGTAPNNEHCELFERAGHIANRYSLHPENPDYRLPEKVRRLPYHKSISVDVGDASSGTRNNEQNLPTLKFLVRLRNPLLSIQRRGRYICR